MTTPRDTQSDPFNWRWAKTGAPIGDHDANRHRQMMTQGSATLLSRILALLEQRG